MSAIMLPTGEPELIEDPEAFRREASLDQRDPRITSVTKILRRAGLVRFHISPEKLKLLAAAGKDAHMVCEDMARGDTPDYWSKDSTLAGYAIAYRAACAKANFTPDPDRLELEVVHKLGYVGRLDQVGWFNRGTRRERVGIVEVKKAAPAPTHALQTAAYRECVPDAKERATFYLKQDGRASVKFHDDPLDWNHFLAAMDIARLRKAWNLISDQDERFFDEVITGAGQWAGDPDEVRL